MDAKFSLDLMLTFKLMFVPVYRTRGVPRLRQTAVCVWSSGGLLLPDSCTHSCTPNQIPPPITVLMEGSISLEVRVL